MVILDVISVLFLYVAMPCIVMFVHVFVNG